jgi:TRAP-type C4-dicarboxylate transport system substrate-binding protein
VLRALAPVLAAALLAAGCAGSAGNKAGGSEHEPAKRLTLTLLTGDSLFAPEYAAAVDRLSGGRMRIAIEVAGNQPAYEAKTVEAVRAGKAELGAVGARVWDAFGVTSFRALVAPFLVHSLALEQRVLASPLAARMLAGLDRAGVVGLAVLPGPLRRPLGLARPLVEPSDYRGATIAIRYGGVARTTLQALGATGKGYTIGHLPAVDGAELDANTIAENGYDARARTLAANVVLWPRPQTIFANRAAFARLTRTQQDVLRRAGREAIAPELARVEKDEAAGLAGLCGRGRVALVTASAAQLAALRRGVQPVYRALERDPLTRSVIAQIKALRAETPLTTTDTARCPGGRTSAAAALEGMWEVTASFDDLVAAGVRPDDAERQRGGGTLQLAHGRWEGRERDNGFVWRGRYTVRGHVLQLITSVCPLDESFCVPGSIAQFTWSVYQDRLSLALASGTPSYWGLIAKPLRAYRGRQAPAL